MSNNQTYALNDVENTPPPLLDTNPEKALGQVCSLLDRMCSFYENENAALRDVKPNLFVQMQPEKMVLAKHYQEILRQMRARQDVFKTHPSELKGKIKDQQNTFKSLANENRELLERMGKGTERLHSRIVDSVKRAVKKRQLNNYTQNGAMDSSSHRRVSTGVEETA